MTDCCTHQCNQGRDCPVRKMPVARPILTELSTRSDVDGGNFHLNLVNTVPPAVDLAAVHARAQQAQAARAQGQDDPKDPPDWRNLSLHGDSDAPGTWLAIIGVAGLVAFICFTFGYMWRLYGPTVLELINRHAATLGLPG